jgi:hypothetical protein
VGVGQEAGGFGIGQAGEQAVAHRGVGGGGPRVEPRERIGRGTERDEQVAEVSRFGDTRPSAHPPVVLGFVRGVDPGRLQQGVCLVWAGGTGVCGHGRHFPKGLIFLGQPGRSEPIRGRSVRHLVAFPAPEWRPAFAPHQPAALIPSAKRGFAEHHPGVPAPYRAPIVVGFRRRRLWPRSGSGLVMHHLRYAGVM